MAEIRPHCAWDALTQAFIGMSSQPCTEAGLIGVMYSGVLFRLCYQHWAAWKDAESTSMRKIRDAQKGAA